MYTYGPSRRSVAQWSGYGVQLDLFLNFTNIWFRLLSMCAYTLSRIF